MKPCDRHLESIALLAAGTLPDRPAIELREHLSQCPGCRIRAEELKQVCGGHTDAANLSLADGPELDSRVLRQVAAVIRSKPEAIGWFHPRFAALTLLIALLGLGGMVWMRAPRKHSSVAVQVVNRPEDHRPRSPGQESNEASETSLQTYRLALARSPQALEELLTSQALTFQKSEASQPGEPIMLSHRE